VISLTCGDATSRAGFSLPEWPVRALAMMTICNQ